MNGAATFIVTTGDDRESDQGNELKFLRFRRNVQAYKISFSLGRWLRRHVREFDLVHIHALFSYSSRAAARAAQIQGVPYIVRPLGVLNRWGMANRRRFLKKLWLKFVELPILKKAAAIHYTSQAELDEAAMVDERIRELPSFIIPIPVAVETASRSQVTGHKSQGFLEAYPKAQGKKIVLFLARLDEKKGLDVLLQAFAEVKREHNDSILVVAGSGQPGFVNDLHRQAAELGIADDIIWTGFLAGPQKVAAFSAATVFVLPSYSENFGIAAAEALAFGVPTVLSDQVAIAGEAAGAKAAIVVRPEGMEIAQAITKLLSDQGAREELGRKGKLFAQGAYSPRLISEQLILEYRKILNLS